MKETTVWDRNVVALVGSGVVFVLFLLAYFFPRQNQLQTTRESIKTLNTTRQEVSVLLPLVARTAFTSPIPSPDVRSWIAANALGGLEKNLVANDGYLEGKGAQVKLRRMSPDQAARFLSQLTRVRLVIERMTLQDSDGDGRWDMEINLKVPDPV